MASASNNDIIRSAVSNLDKAKAMSLMQEMNMFDQKEFFFNQVMRRDSAKVAEKYGTAEAVAEAQKNGPQINVPH